VIYATMYHRPVAVPPTLAQVPTVLLDCFDTDGALPSVVPDEEQGGYTATAALIKRGHRRIGFINYEGPVPATDGRLQGYQAALAANGIAFDKTLVVAGPSNSAGGYHAALELMNLRKRPTALFCFNDSTAMGAYDALRKLGLSIPGDVAVVGFDNHELLADQLYPPLASMELPHYEMGQWAVEYLLAHGDNPPPVQHRIACRFVERPSL
jgi:LacI family transcriptional regulator